MCYNLKGDRMKYIKLSLQGFIIGIGKIIPGVSGAMFAMMFGVYERALKVISNLKKELKGNFIFITVLGLSVLLAIIFGSNIINKCLDNYYIQTMFLFIGMMVAGIKPLLGNVKGTKLSKKNLTLTLGISVILLVISLVDFQNGQGEIQRNLFSVVMLFISGFLDAMATIIPGICGTALLMILGYYDTVISSLGNVFDASNLSNNLFVLTPFVIGLIVGVIVVSKFVNYLFNNYKVQTYYTIVGFAIMSIIILFVKTITVSFVWTELLISIILFVVGFIIVRLFDKLKVK